MGEDNQGQISQKGSIQVKQGKTEQIRSKLGQRVPNLVKQGLTMRNGAKLGQIGPLGAIRGQMG